MYGGIMYYEYSEVQSSGRSLLAQVFSWMSVALGLTSLTAFFVYYNDVLRQFFLNSPTMLFGLLIAQLVVVIVFSFMIYRVSFITALILFLTYAVLTGITLSTIFLVYTMSSIASTFVIAAGMFGAMALYGFVTGADLSTMGSFLRMALVGIIIAMLVNLFLRSEAFNTMISVIAVVVFTGLTAVDVQRIKQLSAVMARNSEPALKIALIGALTLYLDFINLFLSLLQLTGRRKE